MARRVGFGDDGGAGAWPRKQAGPVARLVIGLFLLVWLAGWSYGIRFAFTALADVWSGASGQVFDWAAVIFLATWLGGALIAWAFGVVILFVFVFGRQSSPEERRARLERKLARLEARNGG